MSKNKLQKFAEIAQMPNVFQNFSWETAQLVDYQGNAVDYRGNWASRVFHNHNPICLELACGYGEYTVALAAQDAQRNFIGIDIKGNRIWRGASQLLAQNLHNGAFMRTAISLLPAFFGKDEVAEMWITFPDPHIQAGKHKKRLTSAFFIGLYRQFMPQGAVIHLKTDSTLLYDYTLETIAAENCTLLANVFDIAQTDYDEPLLKIKTRYEGLNLSRADTIKYLKFTI
jgi:tRNA (guanine-N7-)-methyltransferase